VRGLPAASLRRLGPCVVDRQAGEGQANYYLQQVERRIDRVTSVASGVEDYYLSEGEAAGEWIGSGPLTLGLRGSVDAEHLHRVLAGEDPLTGDPLRSTRGTRVPGFDLTFSAPKGVSLLFGICDDDVRAGIQRGHDRAVEDALGYLERVAASARRGHGGAESVAGDGLVAAAFRHRTSRAGDPQVHTHVLVANLVKCSDGRWSAVDGRRIYAHAKTAGYLYEARLRAELTASFGFEWTPIRNGISDVAGVPAVVCRAFSRRRVEIEAEMERRGNWTAAAAQAAALETRRSKDRLIDARRLMPEWRARAEANGLSVDLVAGLFHRRHALELDFATVREAYDRLASPHGLTRAWSSFSRRDAIRALCEQLPAGSRVASKAIEQLADGFLASERAAPLLGTSRPPGDPLRRSDGRVAPLLQDERRYSTPDLLAIEQRIVGVAVGNARLRVGLATDHAVEATLGRRPFLAAEQTSMVRRLTQGGGQIVAVVGKAGSGKTTALSAAREAWAASGLRVIGVAVARRAARELQESAGIPSTSLAGLLLELRRGGSCALALGAVVVLDEASMASSRDLGELVVSPEQVV
jgi:conjugative relaxase-like TrwC/TraI family protein